jgi:hypothetical protein
MRLAACLAVGAVALSGCSEKREASNTLPTASSSAAETTPKLSPLGPKDFPVPAEAREKTPEGAVEFVRYYLGLAEYVAEQGLDPRPLLELSRDCRTCGQIAQAYSDDRDAGFSYRDYSFTFEEYGPAVLDGEAAEIAFTYSQTAITVEDADGQVVAERSTGASGDLPAGAHLLWEDALESWVLTSMTVG